MSLFETQRQVFTLANAPNDLLWKEVARRRIEAGIKTGPKPTCECGECAKCRNRDRVKALRDRRAAAKGNR